MNKVLIANRGEIAVRVIRTCRKLGITTVAVYSEADRDALHVSMADEAVLIGPAAIQNSYMNSAAILTAAQTSGADAIHPGYGFLSEQAEFAESVIAADINWIGPPPAAMRAMASKISARTIAAEDGVPLLPAVHLASNEAIDEASLLQDVGLPLLVKSSAGGGGIGMREVHSADELSAVIASAREQAQRQFGSGDLVIEKLLLSARHIEVQVVADEHGQHRHLFERDCSAQRRRQKILEEAPAPGLSASLREALYAAALNLSRAVNYTGVGTVEFLVQDEQFYLLEMNTRLQVEHGVTEAITGLDLVELQLQLAAGDALDWQQDEIMCSGHAIQARVYAEDPAADFLPQTGTILELQIPSLEAIRLDSGIERGSHISHHYDGLLFKLISHGHHRQQATDILDRALRQNCLAGLQTNMPLLTAILASQQWREQLHIRAVETSLQQWLTSSAVSHEQQKTLAAIATIADFVAEPPPADQRFWPGAEHIARSASWQIFDDSVETEWRWLSEIEFSVAEPELLIRLIDASTPYHLVLELNSERSAWQVTRQEDSLWLWSRELGNQRLQAIADQDSGPGHGEQNHCLAAGPGLVLKQLVQPGQAVEAGEALIILESMKMESSVSAPRDGTISEISVAEGDMVSAGQLLISLADN